MRNPPSTRIDPYQPRPSEQHSREFSLARRAGRAAEAIPLHERTLADCERVLGPDRPATLNSRNNLADAYRAAGRAD